VYECITVYNIVVVKKEGDEGAVTPKEYFLDSEFIAKN